MVTEEEERPQQAHKEDGSGREELVKRPSASRAPPEKCPRCDSSNTKFCYYNNYSLSQPRHFCKACKRYWTKGGALRNVPFGGGCRRGKRPRGSTSYDGDSLQEWVPPPFPPMVQLHSNQQQHQLMLSNTHAMSAAVALAAARQMVRPSMYYNNNATASGVGMGGLGGSDGGGYHGSYSGIGVLFDLQAAAAASGSPPSYHRLPPFAYQHPQPRQREEQQQQCFDDKAEEPVAAPPFAMSTTLMAGLSPVASSPHGWQTDSSSYYPDHHIHHQQQHQ